MVRSMQRRALLFAVLLALVAADARAQRVTEVFAPAHRLAEELLPVAEAAIGSEGEALLDARRNSLILIGTPDAVAQALSLLRRQDRSVPVVRLRYRSLGLSELAGAGLEIVWEAEVGVGVGRVASTSLARGQGRQYRTKQTRDFAGELRIQSGEVGHVGRGRAVPLEGRDHFGRLVSGVSEAERGFSARPRVLGNGRIQLEFAGTDATVDDGGTVEFSKATTTLVVDPGQTVVIGALAQASRNKQANGRSFSTRADEDKRIFLLTLDIEQD